MDLSIWLLNKVISMYLIASVVNNYTVQDLMDKQYSKSTLMKKNTYYLDVQIVIYIVYQ